MAREISIWDAKQQLETKAFQKATDLVSDYEKNALLYFRKIDENRFIIFSHYNSKYKEEKQGFDCWISTYNSVVEIGKKKALSVTQLKMSFDFDKDWEFLSEYL